MKGPRFLVVFGHPHDVSFNRSLAIAYAEGARSEGAEVRILDLAKLDFDPVLRHGYAKIQKLEPDLLKAQRAIEWCDHLVLAYPVWWGAAPGLLKGFLDRTFLPGWAFKFRKFWPLPKRLLRGRSAHVIVTMDAPRALYGAIYRGSAHHSVIRGTLAFCGFGPVRHSTVGSVKYLPRFARKAWLLRLRARGAADARRIRRGDSAEPVASPIPIKPKNVPHREAA